jgi:hypothetical protein
MASWLIDAVAVVVMFAVGWALDAALLSAAWALGWVVGIPFRQRSS